MDTTVYLCNMSEDVWPFISAMGNAKVRESEIDENANLTDRDLFGLPEEDQLLFVSPRMVSSEFLAYRDRVLGRRNHTEVIAPKNHSGQLSLDVLNDPAVWQKIVAAGKSSEKLILKSYACSMQFLDLVDRLRGQGIIVVTPEAPEREDAWTVNFYGSKSGIRQLAGESRIVEPDFVMADGVICMGIEDAAKIAAKKYLKENGVVLKTNKGHSGAGLLIFSSGKLPNEYLACEKAVLKELQKDPYWKLFPVVIESFVASNANIGGGFPDVEFRVAKNGRVEYLYYCGMRIDSQGVFKGVEIHNEVVSERIAAQMVDTGFFIAESYAAAGYRGYFDIDFIAAKNGSLYVTESNVRRTGGTHVYHTAYKLFGKDFMYLTYILSNNIYELPVGQKWSFNRLLELFAPILFDNKKREGLILCSENLVSARNSLAYIIFGNNKKRALEIEGEMEKLLSK